ncbi:MAG: HlyD family efflux transporter periplasmic adaptor subunit [Gammaproteobacteria bacterium]|jgi:adhesin transport system membrane fusion protein|nr:HlyD family efflux transporter periplasmic adaptor subunit [Gammaproteobacteria bacterium]
MKQLEPQKENQDLTYGWQERHNVFDLVSGESFQVPKEHKVSGGRGLFYLLILGLILFITWAYFFQIDQAVRAQGKIIPSARTQVIQVADGGVLESLNVQEGDKVVKGQDLAVLEKERVNASYEETRSKVADLEVALIRAQAEGLNREPDFSAINREYADLIQVQQDLYLQNNVSLQDELITLQGALDLATEELNMNKALFESGDISRLDVMRSQREVNDLKGKQLKIRNDYLQRARKEATDLEGQLASARFKLEERKSVLDHTVLVAPVDGVVKFLKVTTLGGVLRAGDELMHISPTDGDVVVEMKLQPVDIGQLKLGLPVTVKLDAYDPSIFGGITGELVYISSDTLTEQVGEQTMTHYRGHVRLDPQELQTNEKIQLDQLKQGMTATVDIRTGTRTVLEFMAKPIFRAFSGALIQK